jgi:chromosome segregation ATPase
MAGLGIALILILAAVVIFDIYRRSSGYRRAPASKKSKVRDFRAIDELKHKTFKGFDKKLDTVKTGTELASEIRDLRKKREKLEFERERLQRQREREELPEHQFEIDKEKLDREINETSAEIDELKSRLNELKRSNK